MTVSAATYVNPHFVLARLQAQFTGAAGVWLHDACADAARADRGTLLHLYTDASRQLGRTLLEGDAPGHWTLEDAGRLLILSAWSDALSDARDEYASGAVECYRQGDTREQLSWLRTVAWLPEPERFLPVVIDACRTSIIPLFEAVACENVYPARYFPELNFNQVVLKALFNGIALRRIIDLQGRRNPELSRMAGDYADERRAAGRSIPGDISLAMSSAA